MKYKWRVCEEPVGPWRSFERRGWPSANYLNESMCADIICADAYVSHDVRKGNHAPLTLRIADHSRQPFVWVRSKRKYATLIEAKQALKLLLKKNPHLIPEETK